MKQKEELHFELFLRRVSDSYVVISCLQKIILLVKKYLKNTGYVSNTI